MASSAKGKDKKMSVLFYLGHKASYRTVTHPKGYTHDWHAYVKGKDGYKIEHIVDRVVFRLHESFENPVQERKKAPYEIRESGYASFAMYIDIYFKEFSEMITYPYDLYLPGEGNPAVSYERIEKMSFGDKRISSHFRKLLIQAGAQIDSDSGTSSSSSKDDDSSKLKKKDKKKDKTKHKKHDEKTSRRSSSDFSQPKSKHTDSFSKSVVMDSDTNSNSSSSSSSSSPVNNSKPLVSAPTNPHTTHISDLSDSEEEQTSRQNKTQKAPSKRPSTSSLPTEPPRKAKKGAIRASNGLPLEPLLDLHERIKSITDVDKLQRVVDLIGESGQFKMNETTFDFDLCQLDSDVIKKLKGII